MDKKKSPTEYEIVDLGIEHDQYFQGFGTAFTEWDHVIVGVGDDAKEALEDALEQTAMSFGVIVEPTKEEIDSLGDDIVEVEDEDDEPIELHYRVGIRFKLNE